MLQWRWFTALLGSEFSSCRRCRMLLPMECSGCSVRPAVLQQLQRAARTELQRLQSAATIRSQHLQSVAACRAGAACERAGPCQGWVCVRRGEQRVTAWTCVIKCNGRVCSVRM